MFLQIAVTVFAAAFWYQRFQYDRSGAARDMKVVLFCFFLFTPWSESHWTSKIWMFNLCAYPWSYKKWHQRKRQKASYKAEIQKAQQELPKGLYRSRFDFNDRWSPMKPVIFPCRTAHTRLFPKKHSFSYSYLFVGIPVGWRGYISTILSADLKTLPWSGSSPRDDWFNVDSANHLARGENIHGLQGKLEEYLVSQVGSYDLRCLCMLMLLSSMRRLRIIHSHTLLLPLLSLATPSIQYHSGTSTTARKNSEQ